MKDLSGKIAIVTGASRGLGQRAAIRLADRGRDIGACRAERGGLEIDRARHR